MEGPGGAHTRMPCTLPRAKESVPELISQGLKFDHFYLIILLVKILEIQLAQQGLLHGILCLLGIYTRFQRLVTKGVKGMYIYPFFINLT